MGTTGKKRWEGLVKTTERLIASQPAISLSELGTAGGWGMEREKLISWVRGGRKE